MADLRGCPTWRSDVAVLRGCPAWLSDVAASTQVACRIMLKMALEGGLFGGRVPDALMGPPWAFHAGDVAAIHSDESQ